MSRLPLSRSAEDLEAAVRRLAARQGEVLKPLGRAVLDAVSVRRFREAIGLDPDPALGVPPMMVAHLLRPDVDVRHDVRPVEAIDAALVDPVNGGTEVLFERPLALGDEISGELVLHQADLRQGRSGPMAAVVTEARFRNAARQDVARVRLTMLYRAVRVDAPAQAQGQA